MAMTTMTRGEAIRRPYSCEKVRRETAAMCGWMGFGDAVGTRTRKMGVCGRQWPPIFFFFFSFLPAGPRLP